MGAITCVDHRSTGLTGNRTRLTGQTMSHDNVVCAAVFGMVCEFFDRIEILVGYGDDYSGLPITFIDSNFEVALALFEAHGEELTLLASDKQTLDFEIVNPVADI